MPKACVRLQRSSETPKATLWLPSRLSRIKAIGSPCGAYTVEDHHRTSHWFCTTLISFDSLLGSMGVSWPNEPSDSSRQAVATNAEDNLFTLKKPIVLSDPCVSRPTDSSTCLHGYNGYFSRYV